ncbi:MAG: hypothetical protein K8R92_05115 [Planctomycetes bacterium]|nr:hypothetical protein [Planctomycetota bacterium]
MSTSIVHKAWEWFAQCEEHFLGRARTDAESAVRDALRQQSPKKFAAFETRELCCLGLYQPPLSDLALAVKKNRWSRAGALLGQALGRRVASRMNAALKSQGHTWIVVPIPTPFLRRLSRGIDHSDLIAASVARELNLPLCRALWQRFGRTQKTLDRSGRLRRVQRFKSRRRHRRGLAGKSILLVDDIRTTGATIEEASRVLRQRGAVRIAAAVICVVE